MPTLTAFAASPDKGRGLARDMRVRWACEEVGLPYEARLLSFAELKEPPHVALHPFGQIPTFEDGPVTLFESGAIVLHVASHGPGLLPKEPVAKARALSWLFAALNTVEPVILERVAAVFTEQGEPWAAARLAALDARIKATLAPLARHLEGRDWLEQSFTLGDLMMAAVLMRLTTSGLLDTFPALTAYLSRAQSRPAYQRAFAAQRAVYLAAHPELSA